MDIKSHWQSDCRYSSQSDIFKQKSKLVLLIEKGVYPYDYMKHEYI